MKRRDWKIKKLKKNIYDNFNKSENSIFLRKLYIKKVNNLFKKDLKPNFLFYSFLLKIFNKKKNQYIYKNFYNFFKNRNNLIPIFFFKNYDKNNFMNLLLKNNLDFFIYNKSFNKNIKNIEKKKGLLLNIYNNNNYKYNYSFFFEDEESRKDLFFLKNYSYVNNDQFNYNVFYNINILCVLEIYKIIYILYLYKLNY